MVRVILIVVAALTLASPAAMAEQAAPAVAVVRLHGSGHGHGVGLSQWGAHDMALAGRSSADILAHYYPGTSLGSAGGEVVVGIHQAPTIRLRFPSGGTVQSSRGGAQAPGFPVEVEPGGTVIIERDPNGYRVGGAVTALASSSAQPYRPAQSSDCILLCRPEPEPEPEPEPSPTVPTPTPTTRPEPEPSPPTSSPPTSSPPTSSPPTSSPPDGGGAGTTPGAPVSPTPPFAVPAGGGAVEVVDRGRAYRGLVEVTAHDDGLRARNHVDVESYLAGMAEVPASWPAAALEAQSIAARTYALRAMQSSGELCDSERCQVYVGVSREAAASVRAVEATRGVVVTHDGALASTFYSASGGGYSATLAEGFGRSGSVPYLQARPEPVFNVQPWSIDIALADVASRLDYPGTVAEVEILDVGPSGRPLAMVLRGDAGDVPVDPQEFRRSLGLRSTLFTIESTDAAVAPPPPPTEVPTDVVGDPEVAAAAAPTTTEPAPTTTTTTGPDLVAAPPSVPARSGTGATALVAVALAAAATALATRRTADDVQRVGWVPVRWRATMPPWMPRRR